MTRFKWTQCIAAELILAVIDTLSAYAENSGSSAQTSQSLLEDTSRDETAETT